MTYTARSLRVPLATVLMGTLACAEQTKDLEPELPPQSASTLDSSQALLSEGEEVTLTASRDTGLVKNPPNRNDGTLPLLSGDYAVLAFDSTQLDDAVGPTDLVLSAKLRLTLPSAGQARATIVGAHRMTKVWTELGATYKCAIDSNPANSTTDCAGATAWSLSAGSFPWVADASNGVAIARGQTGVVEIDLTGDVKLFLSSLKLNEGWSLVGTHVGDALFQSRESAAPPTLTLNVRRCNATLCDDGNSCTVDSCDAASQCVHTPAADGASCSDSNVCTVGDSCSSAACVPGAVAACGADAKIAINEIESSGGVPGDWVELINTGTKSVNLSGWVVKDSEDSHVSTLPANTVLAPGQYLVVEETSLGFGLGSADAVRLFDINGALVDSHSWTAHAGTTYARCPDGTGAFINAFSVTKGAKNGCAVFCPPTQAGCSVVLNEVESNGGTPGDWVELFNPGSEPADVSGWLFKDSEDSRTWSIPAGTIIAPSAYLVLEEGAFGFGLGAADSARLFDTTGKVIDSYSWTAHAGLTYARCPNGSGAFASSSASTKGAVNACAAPDPFSAWRGGNNVTPVDPQGLLASNLSGLHYEPANGVSPAVLWGVQNSPSVLWRFVAVGSSWVPATDNGWAAGKTLLYPNGAGSPDGEGVTRAEYSSSAIYVATERDNGASTTSRMSVLRFDTAQAGATLTATHEWNLTADLPVSGANAGLEAITWVPDSVLVSQGFRDENRSVAYDPAFYPDHGTGVFFIGLESSTSIYAYVLNHVTGTFQRIATVVSGQLGTMDLAFDREVGQLWSYCDDACGNRSTILRVDQTAGSATLGRLTIRARLERPTGMLNLPNEGIAFGVESECSGGVKSFFWADDAATDGRSIRQGTLQCGAL